MNAANHEVVLNCWEYLDRYFACHADTFLQKCALKVMRFLAVSEEPLAGKPQGWAAGILYAMANRDRQGCGVPGLLNNEFETLFDVSMSTIRKRTAQVTRALDL